MKKYIYLLAGVMFACQSTQEKNSLLQEVITIHDEAMEDMGPIMNLKLQLRESMDSTRLAEYEPAMKALDDAHENMMVWMRNFSKEFPSATLKGDDNHHEHHKMDNGDHTQHSRSVTEEKELLENEKVKVIALQKEMKNAIETAEKLLNKNEN